MVAVKKGPIVIDAGVVVIIPAGTDPEVDALFAALFPDATDRTTTTEEET